MAGHGRVIGWLMRVRQEPAAMVTLIVVAAGIWSFGKLAEAVTAGSTESFDERVVLALAESFRSGRPDWSSVGRRDAS